MCAGSAASRRISAAIGASFETASSASAGLKRENCAPAKSFSTVSRLAPASSHLKAVADDLASLGEHASFLSSQVSFLLDATLGLINNEQNGIIKIVSVAALVFLPPTLVASIYGMNFRHLPELGWRLGYPMALGLMLLSAVLPYAWFRRKGWL